MQVHEFTERLAKKFSKDVSSFDIEDMEKYLCETGIPEDKIELLYNAVTMRYGWAKFPPLKYIVDAYEEIAQRGGMDGKFDGADHGIDDGAALNVDTILTRMKTLRDNQDRRELTSSEIDFLHAWDALPYVSDHLNHEWPGETHRISSYLRTIKDQIISRERINFSGLPGLNIKVSNERNRETRRFENPIEPEDAA